MAVLTGGPAGTDALRGLDQAVYVELAAANYKPRSTQGCHLRGLDQGDEGLIDGALAAVLIVVGDEGGWQGVWGAYGSPDRGPRGRGPCMVL